MKRGCAIGLVLLLILMIGCQVSPISEPTPASPPEPPQELLEAVPFPVPEEGPTEDWLKARRLFFSAYLLQLEGELEAAVKQYQSSIDAYPTAEAYTFIGWVYSLTGRYDDATQEAKRAIALDPEYGNPYNDIGSYLMEQGKLDEAIPWLVKATRAKRYTSPHYPWLNLGHIWVLKGDWGEALSGYEEVLKIVPDYPVPVVPALEAALFLPPEQDRKPGTKAEQQAVKEVVAQYFQARNSYDADALKNYTEPLSNEVSIAFLLNLAAAKQAGVSFTVYGIQVLHLEDGIAVVETTVSLFGKTGVIWHLLRQRDGTWKVVVRLSTGLPGFQGTPHGSW